MGDISGGDYHAFPCKLTPNIWRLFNRKFVTGYLDVGCDVIYKHGSAILLLSLVFFASYFVPVSKILIMLYLLASVHFKWRHSIKWQMRLLHIVHFVGRWSMLDLFVLALMMSLVTRGQIINFYRRPCCILFRCSSVFNYDFNFSS